MSLKKMPHWFTGISSVTSHHMALQILLLVFQEGDSHYLTGQPTQLLKLRTFIVSIVGIVISLFYFTLWCCNKALTKPTQGRKGLFDLSFYITVCHGGKSQKEPGDRSWSRCHRGVLLTGFFPMASHSGVSLLTSINNPEKCSSILPTTNLMAAKVLFLGDSSWSQVSKN